MRSNIFRYKDLVGNTTTVSLLQRSVSLGVFKNLSIFCGVLGTGKSSCADITSLLLTCSSPKDSEPCLECNSCKANIRAIQSTGRSGNLVKINCAKLDKKEDIVKLIRDVFVLQGGEGKTVYIFEEFHALTKDQQLPFLEEIDRLGSTTYIIITTTEEYRLLPALQSRAAASTFHFQRLTNPESKLLFDRTLRVLEMGKPTKEVEDVVLRYCANIPRNIVEVVIMLRDLKPTEQELMRHLNHISADTFIDLFNAMTSGMRALSLSLDGILSEYGLQQVVAQFKDFMLDAVLLVKCGVDDAVMENDREKIRNSLPTELVFKLAAIVRGMDAYRITEADFKLDVIRMTQLLQGKGVSSILTGSKQKALEQVQRAKNNYAENKMVEREADFNKVETLDWGKLSSMADFKGGESK